jgi:putative ABC transport system permease protein
MGSILQDLRYAARMLARTPGHSVSLVLVLALGIGGTTAMFTVVDGVLLHPLPFSHSDRFATFRAPSPRHVDDALAWWNQNRAFEILGEIRTGGVSLPGESQTEYVPAALVSANFFSLVEEGPHLGRAFAPDDEVPGGDRVAVLSRGLWVRSFGEDPGVIGRRVALNQVPHTIVGVMPRGFGFPGRTDVWIARVVGEHSTVLGKKESGDEYFSGMSAYLGRIAPDATLEQTRSKINALIPRLNDSYAGTTIQPNPADSIAVSRLQEVVVRQFRYALWMLFGAVAFVLLIACANATNLLLARGVLRQREISIRVCLGAGRGRVLRQLLTESVLLALVSGAFGVLLAYWGVAAVRGAGPSTVPRLSEVGVDWRVLGFALAISVLTGVFVGLAPALQAGKVDLMGSLKESGAVSTGNVRGRLRSVLLAAEVALALALLTGAGLTLQSFFRLLEVSPGFDPANIVTVGFSLPRARYDMDAQAADFQQRTLERIGTLPGVVAAGTVHSLPLGGRGPTSLSLKLERGYTGPVQIYYVAGDYFRAIGLPLLGGRTFTFGDNENSHDVIILSQTFAERYWKDKDAVGAYIQIEGEESGREIVGVVGDVKHMGLWEPATRQFYLPYLQPYRNGHLSANMTLLARTASDPMNLAASIREQIQSVDKYVPVYGARSMEELITESTAPYRFRGQLLGVFASLALVLAAMGIYGVMSYSVSQRTHEIGIRMALGAQPGDILWMVVRRGMGLALVGVAIGLAGAFALTRFLESLLFGITATDPATFAGVSVLLAAVALLACYIPARRATKVDPLVALRYE